MSEQFNKTTGHPISAYDLTWSLASFVTMARRREGNYPLSWGAMKATAAPETCKGTSYSSTNNYLPAFAAKAPKVSMACASEVLFKAYINNNVCRDFPFLSRLSLTNLLRSQGTNPYLVGNNSLLGGAVNNKHDLILPMNPGNLNSTDNEWYIQIYLPAGVPVHYQYVMEEANGTLYFQNDTQFVHPAKCGGGLVQTSDSPFFPGGVNNGTSS